jgi:ethanolamine ammonia-lyase small subunit
MSKLIVKDAWSKLSNHTDARIALGRAGAALPTSELLAFGVAHAQARDAVHTRLDTALLAQQLAESGHQSIVVKSRASSRQQYLQRPDLGRRLSVESAERLRELLIQRGSFVTADDSARANNYSPLRFIDAEKSRVNFSGATDSQTDIAIVIGDGLSAIAAQKHALPLLNALLPMLSESHIGSDAIKIVIAEQCRVALGDEVGELLGAKLVLILLGERPGLSSPDSLGAYLTYRPKLGRTDAERNCVSNIRPAGLFVTDAAVKLEWLIRTSLRMRR